MFDVSFSGSQGGMTTSQKIAVIALTTPWRNEFGPLRIHHGGCIGADYQMDLIATLFGWDVDVYPSNVEKKQAKFHENRRRRFVQMEKPPLLRNDDIVSAGMRLIAAPKEPFEVIRSGTWATIRRARKLHKPIWIVHPDGSYTQEPATRG